MWMLLFKTSPDTSDDVAQILFGPARLGNDFPRLILPAAGYGEFGVARFIAGEAAWLVAISLVLSAVSWMVGTKRQANSS